VVEEESPIMYGLGDVPTQVPPLLALSIRLFYSVVYKVYYQITVWRWFYEWFYELFRSSFDRVGNGLRSRICRRRICLGKEFYEVIQEVRIWWGIAVMLTV